MHRNFLVTVSLAFSATAVLLVLRAPGCGDRTGPGPERATSPQTTKTARPEGRGPVLPKRALPKRVRPEVLAQFSEEQQEAFYAGPGEMAGAYKHRGLLEFYTRMRGALQGDPDDLSAVFTIYAPGAGDTEGFQGFAALLIESLGDRYFAEQLRKEEPRIQRIVLDQIWISRGRGFDDGTPTGGIPVTDGGAYYPATGARLLELEAGEEDGQ